MSKSELLLDRAAAGDGEALNDLLESYRGYVRRIVEARLEPELWVRADPSDIVQDSLVAASRRIDDFLTGRTVSFRIWLRSKVLNQLIDARRHHFAQKRDVRREKTFGNASSLAIAGVYFGKSVSEIISNQELLNKMEPAITSLSENDQEILLLRSGEGLTNEEAAEVLSIEPKAASKRYGRAIRRLSKEMKRLGL